MRTSNCSKLVVFVAVVELATLVAVLSSPARGNGGETATSVISYDDFSTDLDGDGVYTLTAYAVKWANPFGLGEMAVPQPDGNGDTRSFQADEFSIDAAPFVTSVDFSVFDHIKYIAMSNDLFTIPEHGSITISADIVAETPGTIDGHIIRGTFGPPFSYPIGAPYEAAVLEGQQAGATLHVLNIHETGQLFDWFVSGTKAFCLTERLPYPIAADPNATIDNIYTQIIAEFDIEPGIMHNYAIRYHRKPGNSKDKVEFLIDGEVKVKVRRVGIPLDVQDRGKYGDIIYPSLGESGSGELVKDKMNTFQIAHGVFSLLDAFPFQHPAAPQFSVSIPVEHRIFGQGVRATYDNFKVIIESKSDEEEDK